MRRLQVRELLPPEFGRIRRSLLQVGWVLQDGCLLRRRKVLRHRKVLRRRKVSLRQVRMRGGGMLQVLTFPRTP